MPEYLKALFVILVLSSVVFAFAKAPACAIAMAPKDFKRRRNLWFAITLTVFLAHNFWIYIVVAAAFLFFALPRESNKLAMFFFLLFAVPAISSQITGLGPINNIFAVNPIRLLTLVIMLPAYLSLRKQPDIERFGRLVPDKLIAGYIILVFLLEMRVDTFTNTLRHGVFYAFVDIFLPYYVASRSLKNLQGFRDALMSFVIAALVVSAIGAFENVRHWLLYAPLNSALAIRDWGLTYLERGAWSGLLRAQASIGDPIALGYVIAVAMGFFLYLKKSVPNSMAWGLGMALLVVGLIAPISRGPWVGAAAMLLLFVVTGPSAGVRLAKLGLLGAIILPVFLATPAGETILQYLPFVGTVEEGNVTYRQQLLEISIQLIRQNPFFGSPDFIYSPALRELERGGFIDIVNTYVGVGLSSGLVGLSLFSGVFLSVAFSIFKTMRNVADRSDEHYLLGQGLFSTLIGILVIIFTVSSIQFIPVIYWSVAGLGVAYARMLAHAKAPAAVRAQPVFSQRR